jgi:hypothetical protein
LCSTTKGLLDQSLDLKITTPVGTNSRPGCPAKYAYNLDFADDTMLILDNAVDAQKYLMVWLARRVNVKINRAKTAFMLVGNWSSSLELRVSTGTNNQVQDFTFLGSWRLS